MQQENILDSWIERLQLCSRNGVGIVCNVNISQRRELLWWYSRAGEATICGAS